MSRRFNKTIAFMTTLAATTSIVAVSLAAFLPPPFPVCAAMCANTTTLTACYACCDHDTTCNAANILRCQDACDGKIWW